MAFLQKSAQREAVSSYKPFVCQVNYLGIQALSGFPAAGFRRFKFEVFSILDGVPV
jgi:hypothetical protein